MRRRCSISPRRTSGFSCTSGARASFNYLTSTDPTNPSGWSAPTSLYRGKLDRRNGALHQRDLLSFLRGRQRKHLPGVDADRRLPGHLHRPDDRHDRQRGQPVRGRGGLHGQGGEPVPHDRRGDGQRRKVFPLLYRDRSRGFVDSAGSDREQSLRRRSPTSPSAAPLGRATSAAGIWFATIPTRRRPSTRAICNSSTRGTAPRQVFPTTSSPGDRGCSRWCSSSCAMLDRV